MSQRPMLKRFYGADRFVHNAGNIFVIPAFKKFQGDHLLLFNGQLAQGGTHRFPAYLTGSRIFGVEFIRFFLCQLLGHRAGTVLIHNDVMRNPK